MRAPRRSFGSPFVVTLAAIPAIAAACNPPPPHMRGAQHHPQPQPQGGKPAPTPTNVENPPRPQPEPAPDSQPKPPIVMTNPPPPSGEPVKPSTPANGNLSWYITKKDGKCHAMDNNACKVPAGQPAPPCNPPPPRVAKCPTQMADGGPGVTVTQLAGQTECVILPPPVSCKPNATCNPPPPTKVTCPF
jgi:hypothetical protein